MRVVGDGSTDAGGFGTTCVNYNCNAVYIPQILGVGIHKQQQDDRVQAQIHRLAQARATYAFSGLV